MVADVTRLAQIDQILDIARWTPTEAMVFISVMLVITMVIVVVMVFQLARALNRSIEARDRSDQSQGKREDRMATALETIAETQRDVSRTSESTAETLRVIGDKQATFSVDLNKTLDLTHNVSLATLNTLNEVKKQTPMIAENASALTDVKTEQQQIRALLEAIKADIAIVVEQTRATPCEKCHEALTRLSNEFTRLQVQLTPVVPTAPTAENGEKPHAVS